MHKKFLKYRLLLCSNMFLMLCFDVVATDSSSKGKENLISNVFVVQSPNPVWYNRLGKYLQVTADNLSQSPAVLDVDNSSAVSSELSKIEQTFDTLKLVEKVPLQDLVKQSSNLVINEKVDNILMPTEVVIAPNDNSILSWLYISGGLITASLVVYKAYSYLQNRVMTPQKRVRSILTEIDVSVLQGMYTRIIEITDVKVDVFEKPILSHDQIRLVLVEGLYSQRRRQLMVAVMLYKFEMSSHDKKQLVEILTGIPSNLY